LVFLQIEFGMQTNVPTIRPDDVVGRVDLSSFRLSHEEKNEEGTVDPLPRLDGILAKGSERNDGTTVERVVFSTGPKGGLGVYESCALSPVKIVGRDA
jgi:hypothetical protein